MKCYAVKDIKSGLYFRTSMLAELPGLYSKEEAQRIVSHWKGKTVAKKVRVFSSDGYVNEIIGIDDHELIVFEVEVIEVRNNV